MTIYEVLTARYLAKGVAPEVGIRQETNLNPNQVGEPDLDGMDEYVKGRINTRADVITGNLIVAAGRYNWPMSEQELANAWPRQDAAQRANTARIILGMATDAVYSGAKGDLFGRAAPRSEAYANERDYLIGNPKVEWDRGQAGILEKDAINLLKTARQVVESNPVQANQLNTVGSISPADRCRATEWDPDREPWEGSR